MADSIYLIEKESMKESVLHSLDGRIKLILLTLIIVYAVFSTQIIILVVLEAYLLLLIYISKISFETAFKRILILLPFSIFIIAFQPFIHPGDVIYQLPFGINVTYQGLMFATLLFSRIIVTLTSIILLSSISPMQEVVQSFRKLGMPRDFSMILSLMIRFLFLFYDELKKINNAQASRNFDIFNRNTSYMWRLKQIGFTVMMMFLRSYERGESIYLSMLSRGYSDKSQLYSSLNRKIGRPEYFFIIITLLIVVSLQFLAIFFFPEIGLVGISIK